MIKSKIKKDYNNKGLQQNGITLVALVITIVILLILAGVVISQLMESGLFNKTNMAKTETDKRKAFEELNLLVLEVQTEKEGSATLQDVVNKLQEDTNNEYAVYLDVASITNTVPKITDSTESIYVIYKGFKFKIDNKLQVTIIDDEMILEPESKLDYDTVLETINSKEEFSKLIETKSNVNDLVSDINTYKEIIIDNQNAMECIGNNEYAGNKMIQNKEWREAILSSKYLDDFNKGATTVPTMTSDTSPEGEVFVSYLGDSNLPFKCFDGDDTSYGSIGRPNTLNGYIGYHFTKEVIPYYVSILNYSAYNNYFSDIKIQGLDEYGTWIDLTDVLSVNASGWSYIELKSNEAYSSYKSLRILQTTDKGSAYYAGAYTIQFYCRTTFGIETTIDESLKNLYENAGTKKRPKTIQGLIGNNEVFLSVLSVENNVDYIMENSNIFKGKIINNQNAMECIGENEYAGIKMIQNKEWREAILSSKYLDDFNKGATTVPTMTSDTSPEGEVFVSYLGDSNLPFKCFDGDDTSYGSIGRPNTLNGYIGYHFTKEVIPYYVSILNYSAYNNYFSDIKIQGLDEYGTWIDLTDVLSVNASGWSYIELKSNEAYSSYKSLRILQTTDKGSAYYAAAYTIQFYCRSVIE